MNKFTYEIMDETGRWRRSGYNADSVKDAIEAMAEFAANAYSSQRRFVAVRLALR